MKVVTNFQTVVVERRQRPDLPVHASAFGNISDHYIAAAECILRETALELLQKYNFVIHVVVGQRQQRVCQPDLVCPNKHLGAVAHADKQSNRIER